MNNPIEFTRRLFLKLLLLTGLKLMIRPSLTYSANREVKRLGVSDDGLSHIYVANGGSPEENMRKIIEMMGGIDKIISLDDIVIIKPNSQWWNQGMTNTNTIKEFINQILRMPGFTGEIIVADNHQYQKDNSRGWTTDTPNGDYNLNELVELFQSKGFSNVTKYNWHCGGPNKGLVQGDGHGHSVVGGPGEGDGYVWRHDMVYQASSGRKTMMSYPVFTSHYSGITIDFMRGAYKNGERLNRKVRFINFPSLNHHSGWGGVTSCIKNYLGVVDMSCGYHGETPKGFFNFHYVGLSDMNTKYPRVELVKKKLGMGYIDHFHGGPVGYFMKHVRMADLNIVTADWAGYGSRTDPELSFRPKTVLASRDPVAMDYYSSKYVLLPGTPINAMTNYGESFAMINNPDNMKGALRMFLVECYNEGIGNIHENRMKVHKYEFGTRNRTKK
ncbi:MAG TPA: DUF362 domain-containing protein [Syntrophorhabdus sp.]|nr:DUF362 domain-containing protein [Syntrophorhabdus sp.]